MTLTADRLERVLGTYARLVERRLKTGMHMTPRQYAAIAASIHAHAPCAALIFGCGEDSAMWEELNAGGRTVFLENAPSWAQRSAAAGLDVIAVEYESRLHQWMRPPARPRVSPTNFHMSNRTWCWLMRRSAWALRRAASL